MKVKVKIIKTDKSFQAFCIQEGRSSDNLVKRRANSIDLAKTYAVASLPKGVTGIEWDLEGVEE
jgi:hypothetical protein